MHHDNCVQAKSTLPIDRLQLLARTWAGLTAACARVVCIPCMCRGLPEHVLQRGAAGMPGEAAGGHVHVRREQVHDRRGHRRDLRRHRGRRRRRQGAAQAVAAPPHEAGVRREHCSRDM